MPSSKPANLNRVFFKLLMIKLLLPSAIVALILVGISTYFNATSIQHDQFITTQFLKSGIDDFLLDAKQAISGLSMVADNEDINDLTRLLETTYTSDPYFHALIVLDSDKKVRAYHPPGSFAVTAIINRLPIFSQSPSGQIRISQPYFSTLPGKPTAYLSTTLNDGGWLVGELQFDRIENVIKNRVAPLPGREVYLVDEDETILVSSGTQSVDKSIIHHTNILTEIMDTTNMLIFNNEWAFGNSSILDNASWQIRVYYPIRYAMGGYLLITSLFIGLLLIIWAAMLLDIRSEFTRKIYKPLIQFNQYINNISEGRVPEKTRPIRIAAPFSEISDLSENFEHMSRAIFMRQQALIDNEQKYRLLIEQSGDAIYLEQNGQFVIINQKFIELFGNVKPCDGQSSGIHCLAAESSAVFVQEQQLRMLSREVTNLRFEFTAVGKNGQEIDVEVATTVFLYRDQIAIQGIIRDVTDRKRAEFAEKEQRTLAEALRDTASTLTSTLNLDEVMERILSNIGNVVPSEALNIMLIYGEPKEARIVASKGYANRGVDPWLAKASFPIEKTPNLNWMYRSKEPVVFPDTSRDSRWIPHEESRWISSYAAAPIKVQGQVIGFLNLESSIVDFFCTDQAERLQVFADQAGIAIHNAQLLRDLSLSHKELVDAYETTLQGWSRALELRDYETQGHTIRVQELTTRLALKLGITEPEITNIRYGALLHDIGKICIPDQILFKKGPLSSHEWDVMREHPIYAFQMLSPIQYLQQSLDIPFCHHEWWDGTGYPRGLKGEEIPLPARIFSIVDVWDALISNRPYHDGMTESQAVDHIKSQSGTQLDPNLVQVFIDMISA